MTSKNKLTYFNITGLGEAIRLLMSYGKIDFEDVRVEFSDWPKLKPSMPLGKLPVLELDGKVAHQSIAICRYLAKKLKLVGDNEWEDLEIDTAVYTITDLRTTLTGYFHEPNQEYKKSKEDRVFNEIVPFLVTKLEEQVKQNNGYLVAGKLTWADLYFAGIANYMNYLASKDIFDNAPGLKALNEKVLNLPAIKAYRDNRPKIPV